ncbi:MAG: DUF5117 domain-containing protein, partial [Gemmatimonas sp.]|nr:DUF5117 domain-containing protein [Gemmatimonas sp.]
MAPAPAPLSRSTVRLVWTSLACACTIAACAQTGPAVPGTIAPVAQAEASDDQGELLPVRYDPTTGDVFLTVRQLGEEYLYLNTLAAGLGTGGLDRGQLGPSAAVRFERYGNRVHLISRNTDHRAIDGDDAARRAVEESFPSSVLAAFEIAEDGPDGLVVDATEFFLSDMYDVAASLQRGGAGAVRVDPARSFIDPEYTGAYPINTEVRAVLTYVTDSPSADLRSHAPDGRSVTLQQQHSFLQLPESPLSARQFDPRTGNSQSSFFDFSQPFDSDFRQRNVARWRLEPMDTAAYLRGELVEPVKPIVYYLDRGIPEPYRSAFLEGGNWWNEVFEAAGWRDAFRVELMPEGVDPMDARYPAIYWVHRQERAASVGPSYRDPRTGEILTTVVRMDSYRSLVDHDIYMGLVPAAGVDGLSMSAEEFAMARRRQHAAHEIGHTLGLAHNFVAASQGRASVMDYPYPLIGLDEEGGIDISQTYRTSGGAHDTLGIRYAYTWYPDAQSESAGLKEIAREAEARGLAFITGGHVNQSGSYPEATQWIEGATMLEALERTRDVRRRLIDHFDESAASPGEPLAILNRRFSHAYLHHRYALEGVIKAIGGMRFGYAVAGEATDPTEIVSAPEQRAALSMVLGALQPDELRIPPRVAAMIPPVPFGYDGDLAPIVSPAGTAFDPIATAHSLAQEIVDNLLHPQRAERLVAFHAQDPTYPGLDEVLGALLDASWFATDSGEADPQDPALRRVTRRAVLDALLDLGRSPDATSEVRAVTEYHLEQL